MNLHMDKEIFKMILAGTSEFMRIKDVGIVEKDYFVTLFLKRIVDLQPDIIFKGGTSLSKCYKIIQRFSEDIDLSVETESLKLTEGQRKGLKKDILSVVDNLGLTLLNPEQVRSRRDFNRYIVDYQPAAAHPSMKQHLIVETAVYIKSFPSKSMNVTSYVYDFLKAKNAQHDIQQYNLKPFKVNVLSLERTFIDKVFALGDYYLADKVTAHSRHLYDLHKLYPQIIFDDSFENLIAEVRQIRKPHISCRSAQDGVNLIDLLNKIISEDFYKADYNGITQVLLFEKVTYAETIETLKKIISAFSI